MRLWQSTMTKKESRRRVAPELDGSGAAPVDLGGFAGSECEAEEGGAAHRTHGAHIVFDDAEAAGVALLVAQALEDLGGTVRVALQPAGDGGFEGIELARPPGTAAAREGGQARILGHGFRVEPQLAADLAEVQAALLMELADFAIGVVVDHVGSLLFSSLLLGEWFRPCRPSAASISRRISPMERASPPRAPGLPRPAELRVPALDGRAVEAIGLSSRLSTW